MFDPDAHMPRINRGIVYLGACLISGIRTRTKKTPDRGAYRASMCCNPLNLRQGGFAPW
jgi:hypothetical protein